MDKLSGESLNIVSENIEKLKQLFPEAFSEGKIDFETLKAELGELGELVETREERYSFNWNGKADARRIAQTPSTGTLRPAKEESVDWDTTQNLFLEGDNLEVLKLLQKSYHAKVKMIYIDPPYNTGKEFIYPDNFRDNLETYLEYTGQKDAEGRKFGTNAETSGRYHTNWLNMMYPRLKLARNLLRDDGVIFISIDDNEVHNLRKICDEIFGEGNFIANIIWEKRFTRNNDAKLMSNVTDHIIVYRKSTFLEKLREPRTEKANSIYSNPDNDPRGAWTSVSYVSQRTKEQRPNLAYKIKNPITNEETDHEVNAWKYSKEQCEKHQKENRLHWGVNGGNKYPRLKRFLSELNEGIVPINFWNYKDTGTIDDGTKIVDSLIGKDIFDYPKPPSLIQRMLSMATADKEGIILDFFAGSGTTAHAVMKLNAEDGGKRRCISVQLPEPTDEKSEAYKEGYKTIAEISKERIRRAGEKIKGGETLVLQNETEVSSPLDIGFKVFKLDSSNIKTWDADFDNVEQSLLDAVDNIKADRTSEDLLYEILLKYGLDLTLPIETKVLPVKVNGEAREDALGYKTANVIGLGALVICLKEDIDLDTVEAIAKLKDEYKPEIMRVVFKDAGFSNDVVKTNAIQILKQHGIDDVKSV